MRVSSWFHLFVHYKNLLFQQCRSALLSSPRYVIFYRVNKLQFLKCENLTCHELSVFVSWRVHQHGHRRHSRGQRGAKSDQLGCHSPKINSDISTSLCTGSDVKRAPQFTDVRQIEDNTGALREHQNKKAGVSSRGTPAGGFWEACTTDRV